MWMEFTGGQLDAWISNAVSGDTVRINMSEEALLPSYQDSCDCISTVDHHR